MSDELIAEAMRDIDAGNYERARRRLETVNDNPIAQLQLAYLYQTGQGGPIDPDKAMAIYEELANAGNAQGMYYLASVFLEKNQLHEALHFFEKSSTSGHVSGSFWAAALNNGYKGHPINVDNAKTYYQRASRLGHYFARRDLARLDMKTASSFVEWVKAMLRYFGAKISGIFAAIRNPQDLRLR
jgi:TPR repeat protein